MPTISTLTTTKSLAKEMIALYKSIYGEDENMLLCIKSHKPNYADTRHCIRTYLGRKYNVGPSFIARAESQIPKLLNLGTFKPVNHSTIVASTIIVRYTLPIQRPSFLRQMRELILNN